MANTFDVGLHCGPPVFLFGICLGSRDTLVWEMEQVEDVVLCMGRDDDSLASG